jgi:hypothetical protein
MNATKPITLATLTALLLTGGGLSFAQAPQPFVPRPDRCGEAFGDTSAGQSGACSAEA